MHTCCILNVLRSLVSVVDFNFLSVWHASQCFVALILHCIFAPGFDRDPSLICVSVSPSSFQWRPMIGVFLSFFWLMGHFCKIYKCIKLGCFKENVRLFRNGLFRLSDHFAKSIFWMHSREPNAFCHFRLQRGFAWISALLRWLAILGNLGRTGDLELGYMFRRWFSAWMARMCDFITYPICPPNSGLLLSLSSSSGGPLSLTGCVCYIHNKCRLDWEMFLNISRMTIRIEPQNLWYIPHQTTRITKDRFKIKMRSQTESSHQTWKSSVCSEGHSGLKKVEISPFNQDKLRGTSLTSKATWILPRC